MSDYQLDKIGEQLDRIISLLSGHRISAVLAEEILPTYAELVQEIETMPPAPYGAKVRALNALDYLANDPDLFRDCIGSRDGVKLRQRLRNCGDKTRLYIMSAVANWKARQR